MIGLVGTPGLLQAVVHAVVSTNMIKERVAVNSTNFTPGNKYKFLISLEKTAEQPKIVETSNVINLFASRCDNVLVF